MEVIHSTPHATKKEEDGLYTMAHQYNQLKSDSGIKMTNIQNIIYVANIILFSVLFYYIYRLYQQKEIEADNISVLVLAILPLFNTLSEMMYYVPDTFKNINTLYHHQDFITELYTYQPSLGAEINFTKGEIRFDHVSFSYHDTIILDDIDIVIPSGSFYTLHGESGSGKSTFLKLILGHLKPTSGTITIDGHVVSELSPISIKQNIMYLDQHASLFHKTVYENILYGHEDTPEQRQRVCDILTKYNILPIFSNSFDFLDKSGGRGGELLSGGQRQLIQIIRCLLHVSPCIIIMDEPTSAIDSKHTDHIIQMIRDIHEQGKTILMISHNEPVTSVLSFKDKKIELI